MSNPTSIGIANRNVPGGQVLKLCDGCRNIFHGEKPKRKWECCRVCVVDGPAQGLKAEAKRKSKQEKRNKMIFRATLYNPTINFPRLKTVLDNLKES